MPDAFNLPPRARLREISREKSNRSRLLALVHDRDARHRRGAFHISAEI